MVTRHRLERILKLAEYRIEKDLIKDYHVHLPSYLIGIFSLIKKVTPKAYIVGGAVRDLILGKKPKDFDIVCDADPIELMPLFEENGWTIKEAGTDFKVLHVIKNGIALEIARFRKDLHPDSNTTQVIPGTILDDAERRDLTINALYLDPWTGEVHDPTGEGLTTVHDTKKIKFMGDPEQRIDEDYSRILRFYRFVDKFKSKGFETDESSLEKVRENFAKVQRIDHNRIRAELEKLVGIEAIEEKMLAMTNPNQHDKRIYMAPKAIKGDPIKVFKFFKALQRLSAQGYLPDSNTLSTIRSNIAALNKMDPEQFRTEMEMLAGILPDMEADMFEENMQALSNKMKSLLTQPRTIDREKALTSLKGKAKSTLDDYLGV